jgi:hypothetical protein
MRRHGRITIGFAILFMVAARSLATPTSNGRIHGHVVDIVGATIAGANVFGRKHEPSEESIKLITHTDARGDFDLDLRSGGYDIVVISPGFAASVESVAVLAGKTVKVPFKLKALDCTFPGVNCDTFQ